MILYMACDTGATGLTGRREYTFLQKPLSRRCFEHIIGISSHRVDKIGCFDQRYASNKKPSKPSLLTASIDSFLLVLYGSVAEPLPNKFLDAFSVNFILVFGHVTPTKKLDKTPLPSPRFIRQGAAKGKTKPGPAEDSDTDQWNGGVEYSSELEQDDDDLVHFLQSNSCFLFNVTQTNAFHVPLQQFVLCHVYAFAQKWRNIYIYIHTSVSKNPLRMLGSLCANIYLLVQCGICTNFMLHGVEHIAFLPKLRDQVQLISVWMLGQTYQWFIAVDSEAKVLNIHPSLQHKVDAGVEIQGCISILAVWRLSGIEGTATAQQPESFESWGVSFSTCVLYLSPCKVSGQGAWHGHTLGSITDVQIPPHRPIQRSLLLLEFAWSVLWFDEQNGHRRHRRCGPGSCAEILECLHVQACGSNFGVEMNNFSMEAKYMVPRSPTLKTAYRSAKYIRPKLKVHGAWAAGWALRIIIVEENSYAGSSLVIELLAMLLQDIANICEESNRASPTTLVVVGDNTVKELKNTFCLSAIANLCNHNKYRSLCWVEILFCLLSLSLSHTFWLFMWCYTCWLSISSGSHAWWCCGCPTPTIK